MSRLVLGAAVGDCVHLAGLLGFLELARARGFDVTCLGAAVPVADLAEAAVRLRPEVVAASYRLDPAAAARLAAELGRRCADAGLLPHTRLVFGGPAPNCRAVAGVRAFCATFGGDGAAELAARFLDELAAEHPDGSGAGGSAGQASEAREAGEGREAGVAGKVTDVTLPGRLAARERPHEPLLRHHFGRPSLEETIAGVAMIAGSGAVDVISIGPDQNFQEHFFHPADMDPAQDGAGGVPLRRPEDLDDLRRAASTGNHPLLRCYSGTADVLRLAGLLAGRLGNAWCAVPLLWYNVLDRRGPRPLRRSIPDAQALMRWHAERGVPVEVNEAHHWGLRAAPDSVTVAASFLAAYNARKAGVRHYVAQYMFNTPAGVAPAMDGARVLAAMALVESLHSESFTSFRQVRAGLLSFPSDAARARGHLAACTAFQMMFRPHILHVVGFTEGDHVARAAEVIEACKVARGAVAACAGGLPDPAADPAVAGRRDELLAAARAILDAITTVAPPGTADPWTDPETLSRAVEAGILDAPHLAGNPHACGEVRTAVIDGSCIAIAGTSGGPGGGPVALPEERRLAAALERAARGGWASPGARAGI